MNQTEDKLYQDIRQLLDLYDLGKLKSYEQLSAGYANLNYRIDTNQGRYLYRVCTQQPLPLIAYEVRLMQALRQIDFPTAYPIASKNGKFIQVQESRYIMIYEFCNGQEPVVNHRTTEAIATAIGKLSKLPNADQYPKKNAVHIDTCDELIQEFGKARNPIPELLQYFKEQTDYLRPVLQVPLPQGVVHGDCFPDNTLFDGDELVAVIDFEEACYENLLFDVSMTINGFCFPDNTLDVNLLTAFVKAYHQQRSLTQKEWELLPVYIQWGAHGMITWHMRNNLLHVHQETQWLRVKELMERVKLLRQNEKQIQQYIHQIANQLTNATY
ncbi:MAG TPA: hypothetical protein DCS93_14870 [Microscillaceae bacterium]|nr:hypothetical protein [Microscillaceae bacterium]